MPGLLQTSAIMAFQPSLSSVLLMSSLLGDSFLVTKLFKLSVYFVHCLPLLLVQTFPLNIIYFSSPSALFIFPKNCSCLFLMVSSRDLLYPAISITSLFDFFSVHDILMILLHGWERKISKSLQTQDIRGQFCEKKPATHRNNVMM